MADMVLLKIGNTDLTAWLDKQNCQFNRSPVYETWTDGNAVNHRAVSRSRISGKAAIGFSKAADFAAFCTLIDNEQQSDGYFNVTAYVNNTGTTETFQAFVDYTAASKWDWLNNREWHSLTLQIAER